MNYPVMGTYPKAINRCHVLADPILLRIMPTVCGIRPGRIRY